MYNLVFCMWNLYVWNMDLPVVNIVPQTWNLAFKLKKLSL
jgi:hypothetical protein